VSATFIATRRPPAVAHAGDLLRRTRVRRSLDAITGTALVALGARLAASDR
jgi:threonine/homoserine/homoserine lactone efflux protein